MTAYEVARLSEIPDRGILLVTLGNLEIGLYRAGDTVRAWRNHCPHMAAPVCRGNVTGTMLTGDVYEYEYGRDGEILQCPWHGWEFDLETGRHLAPGSWARLRGYPTEVVDGIVLLHLRSSPGPVPGEVARAAHRGAATDDADVVEPTER
ncbi:Rieske (2Fe-2S) protein [Microlunatus elymi]|uniref:Rieske (2Fe-2S) protein n=1 Tax=Microlunatus elymi TaxID=2596828 RepID=A0A516PVZ7_9ACTN|nr:Rieske (2Fe-2S) protein [Microlunatus elymi]QDP95357.1 Rieske (2Fe-2S) protein [Microlunatus elymi]